MLAFVSKRRIDRSNFTDLTPVQKDQFIISGELVYGKKLSENEIFKQTYEGYCHIWDVIDTSDSSIILYNVWIFDVDSGIVFHNNSVLDGGVIMGQYGFYPSDKETEELIKLSEMFELAYNLVS